MNGEDLVPIEEAARFLHLAVATIYRLTSAKRLPFYRLGRRCWFRQADLEAFREGQRIEAAR